MQKGWQRGQMICQEIQAERPNDDLRTPFTVNPIHGNDVAVTQSFRFRLEAHKVQGSRPLVSTCLLQLQIKFVLPEICSSTHKS